MSSKSSRVLRVAMVGIGDVAQIIHLPNLLLFSDKFQVVALVDVSPAALSHVSAKFHIPQARTYTSMEAMLANADDVDLVMVTSANEYHVAQTVAALRAGKHVFVEKPMAVTEGGADEIAAAAKAAGRVVFVGFMRRYAEAFGRVKEIVQANMRDIAYVRVRDIIGQNSFFIEQSATFPRRFDDAPPEAVKDREARAATLLAEALGQAVNERDAATWNLLTSLSSHDISAMRELIGMPRRVLSAARSADCNWIWATFEYDGFVAFYEVGIDCVRVFDAHIEVYLGDKRVKVTYDTPFVKGLPITASVQSTSPNGDHREEVIRPTYEDAFVLEYRALYDAIVHGSDVKTTPEDAKEDLVIFKMIMEAIGVTERASEQRQ